MNEIEFEQWLREMLLESDELGEQMAQDARVIVESFEQCGVLTYNRGLVVRLADGCEFQLTIVQGAVGEEVEA